MIIKAFATYLQSVDKEKTNKTSLAILYQWLREILSSSPDDNVKRVIHEEIVIEKNNIGMFIIHAKSKSGKKLLESLYNFALSYEHQKFTRWVHKINPEDFNNI